MKQQKKLCSTSEWPLHPEGEAEEQQIIDWQRMTPDPLETEMKDFCVEVLDTLAAPEKGCFCRKKTEFQRAVPLIIDWNRLHQKAPDMAVFHTIPRALRDRLNDIVSAAGAVDDSAFIAELRRFRDFSPASFDLTWKFLKWAEDKTFHITDRYFCHTSIYSPTRSSFTAEMMWRGDYKIEPFICYLIANDMDLRKAIESEPEESLHRAGAETPAGGRNEAGIARVESVESEEGIVTRNPEGRDLDEIVVQDVTSELTAAAAPVKRIDSATILAEIEAVTENSEKITRLIEYFNQPNNPNHETAVVRALLELYKKLAWDFCNVEACPDRIRDQLQRDKKSMWVGVDNIPKNDGEILSRAELDEAVAKIKRYTLQRGCSRSVSDPLFGQLLQSPKLALHVARRCLGVREFIKQKYAAEFVRVVELVLPKPLGIAEVALSEASGFETPKKDGVLYASPPTSETPGSAVALLPREKHEPEIHSASICGPVIAEITEAELKWLNSVHVELIRGDHSAEATIVRVFEMTHGDFNVFFNYLRIGMQQRFGISETPKGSRPLPDSEGVLNPVSGTPVTESRSPASSDPIGSELSPGLHRVNARTTGSKRLNDEYDRDMAAIIRQASRIPKDDTESMLVWFKEIKAQMDKEIDFIGSAMNDEKAVIRATAGKIFSGKGLFGSQVESGERSASGKRVIELLIQLESRLREYQTLIEKPLEVGRNTKRVRKMRDELSEILAVAIQMSECYIRISHMDRGKRLLTSERRVQLEVVRMLRMSNYLGLEVLSNP